MVEVHEAGCDCSGCIRSDWLHYPWRRGGSVGRTIYVDPGYKHPSFLLGMVDTTGLADHIIAQHNAWLERHSDEQADA